MTVLSTTARQSNKNAARIYNARLNILKNQNNRREMLRCNTVQCNATSKQTQPIHSTDKIHSNTHITQLSLTYLLKTLWPEWPIYKIRETIKYKKIGGDDETKFTLGRHESKVQLNRGQIRYEMLL